MTKITKQQLQSYLWESANILREKIDSGDLIKTIALELESQQ